MIQEAPQNSRGRDAIREFTKTITAESIKRHNFSPKKQNLEHCNRSSYLNPYYKSFRAVYTVCERVLALVGRWGVGSPERSKPHDHY
jgi:hypothetical protein